MDALRRAGTRVYEPRQRFSLEIPADVTGAVLPVLAKLRGVARTSVVRGTVCTLEGEIPAARVHALEQALPGLTRGEAVLDCAFGHYQLVRGPVPSRPRTDHDPLHRKEYLLRVTRGVTTR
jgi:ribosomal protection tetracycline resistance protein